MADNMTSTIAPLNRTVLLPDYDYDEEIAEIAARLERASQVLLYVVAVLGIANNLAFIFTIVRVSWMRNVSNYYLINLSVADLLFLAFRLVYHIAETTTAVEIFTMPGFCMVSAMLSLISLYTSILTVAIISIDRYLAICRPFFYQEHSADNLYFWVIALTWLLAFVLSLVYGLQLCLYANYTFRMVVNINHYLILVASIAVVTVMYALVISTMVTRYRQQVHAHLRGVAWNEMVQTIRLLVVTTLVFYITVFPYQAHYLIFFTLPQTNFTFKYFMYSAFFSNFLLQVNSAINPTIYKITSAKYRKAFCKAMSPCIKIAKNLTTTERENETTQPGGSSRKTDNVTLEHLVEARV